MVSVLVSSTVDRVFEPRGLVKSDSANYVVLRSKSKDWLARNQDNVSEWRDMSTRGLLFQLATTIKIKLSVLV